MPCAGISLAGMTSRCGADRAWNSDPAEIVRLGWKRARERNDMRKAVAGAKEDFINEHGPWSAASIHLGEGIYTFDPPQVDTRLRRVLQTGADIIGKPLEKARVLDLACLEAQFGTEFALHGAKVIAIEGREANISKCQFVKKLLSIENISFAKDDVRQLSAETYGQFDIVLCLGILYHMDTPDAMDLIRRVFEVSSRVAIIETHICPSADVSHMWNGNEYHGSYYLEHESDDWGSQKDKLWSSIGNRKSFKFTLNSLCNLLRHVGFSSVHQCLNPYEYHNPDWPLKPMGDKHVVEKDRVTLVAIKGERQTILSSPITERSSEIDRPEIEAYQGDLPQPGRIQAKMQGANEPFATRLKGMVPERAKRVLRQLRRRVRDR
jgi:hypothetical protein